MSDFRDSSRLSGLQKNNIQQVEKGLKALASFFADLERKAKRDRYHQTSMLLRNNLRKVHSLIDGLRLVKDVGRVLERDKEVIAGLKDKHRL